MAFLEYEDFDQDIHAEILDAVTKGEEQKVDKNISSTIDEMAGYLNGRYDTAAIFSKTGNDRNKFLVRIGLALSTFYIVSMHNPRKMTETIRFKFDKAIEDLEKIQTGKLSPVGLEVPTVEPPASSGTGGAMQWGSQTEVGSSW